MFARKYLAVIAVVALMCPVWHAHAQKMYRCGNAYQDRPCQGAQQGKVVNNWGGSSVGAAQTTDAQCSQRGADALKIVWARDNGALREQQIAEVDSQNLAGTSRDERVQLIQSVYSKRGSAPEIRAAIEAECVADKERQAQAAAALAAAARLQGGAPASNGMSSSGPSAADMERLQARQREEMEANNQAFKKSRCADLARQYENLRSQERVGGSSATMQRLNERRRALDERQRNEGC